MSRYRCLVNTHFSSDSFDAAWTRVPSPPSYIQQVNRRLSTVHDFSRAMQPPNRYAFVTLVTSDTYLPGALALAHSLRSNKTPYPLIVLCPPNELHHSTTQKLYRAFDKVLYVDILKSGAAQGDAENLELLGRPELDITFTKLHAFNPAVVGPYERIAFLDADTFVLRNVDNLFNFLDEESAVFAAAPDVGWPDIFNSGVFVAKPGKEVYEELVKEAAAKGSFDGGDQGLLNSFFSSWAGYAPSGSERSSFRFKAKRLPFIYNVTPSAVYSYMSDIAIVHFAGHVKPWTLKRFTDGTIWSSMLEDELHQARDPWKVQPAQDDSPGNAAAYEVRESADRGRPVEPSSLSSVQNGFLSSSRYEWDTTEFINITKPRSASFGKGQNRPAVSTRLPTGGTSRRRSSDLSTVSSIPAETTPKGFIAVPDISEDASPSSRYNWNPSEISTSSKPRRGSASSSVTPTTPKASSHAAIPSSTAIEKMAKLVLEPASLVAQDEEEEEFDESNDVDEEGFPIKPHRRKSATDQTGVENAGRPRSISPTKKMAPEVVAPPVGSVGVKKYSSK
ncbi:hypothetical protein HDV05_005145 [Chytridiales sp. JEL 0842]|nr:hypothetical protein HDV05_005145 [Chytridiales sp. JEL 0842]